MFSLIAMLGEFLEFDTLLTDKINVKWFKKRPSICLSLKIVRVLFVFLQKM